MGVEGLVALWIAEHVVKRRVEALVQRAEAIHRRLEHMFGRLREPSDGHGTRASRRGQSGARCPGLGTKAGAVRGRARD